MDGCCVSTWPSRREVAGVGKSGQLDKEADPNRMMVEPTTKDMWSRRRKDERKSQVLFEIKAGCPE